MTFFPNEYIVERVGESNFRVEEPDKYDFSQVIEVNTNSDKSQ